MILTNRVKFFALCLISCGLFLAGCASAPKPAPPPPPPPPPPIVVPEPVAEVVPEPEPEPPAPLFPPGTLDMTDSQTYSVRTGDTLVRVARNHYGKENGGFYYPLIQKASGLSENPDRIFVGTMLLIPSLVRNLATPELRETVRKLLIESADWYRARNRYRETQIGLRQIAERLRNYRGE